MKMLNKHFHKGNNGGGLLHLFIVWVILFAALFLTFCHPVGAPFSTSLWHCFSGFCNLP